MDNSLKNFRQKLDEIDEKIVGLFKERMALSENIAVYKYENRLPVYDEKRESEKLENIKLMAGEDMAQYCEMIYNIIINASKNHQKNVIEKLEN